MKTKLLCVILISITTLANSQILGKDPFFGINGVYNTSSNHTFFLHVQSADGSIFYTSISPNYMTVVSKLKSNGTVDTNFGNSGEIILNYPSPALQTFLTSQPDNKFFLVSTLSDNNSIYTNVTRFLSNGQLDNSFGNNGVSTIPNLHVGDFSYSLLQNNKILLFGRHYINNQLQNGFFIYRLNPNGTIDNSFGNNGKITTDSMKFFFLDSQFNIIVLSTQPNSSAIKKFSPDGLPFAGFGNNGVQNLNFSLDPHQAILDSNNRIVYVDGMDENVKRINSDGTLDTSFNFNPNTNNTLVNFLTEKNGFYYIGGHSMQANNNLSAYISRLSQSGAIDPVFGNFIETDPNINSYINLLAISDDSILKFDPNEGQIVKYLQVNSTLSLSEADQFADIKIENPINQTLKFSSKEKINNIEIYSMNGALIKTITDNSTDVSDLVKGNYIVRINLQNGEQKTIKVTKK